MKYFCKVISQATLKIIATLHNLVRGRRKCQQRKARPSFRGSCRRDSCSFHKDYVTEVVKAGSKTSNSFFQNRRRLNE